MLRVQVVLVALVVRVVLVVLVVLAVLEVLLVPPCPRADARRRSHGVLSRHLAPLTAQIRTPSHSQDVDATPVYVLATSHPDLRALCRGFCSLEKSALESCKELAPPAALSVLAPLKGLAQVE